MKIVGGNWKFNQKLRDFKEAEKFITQLEKKIEEFERVEVKIFPHQILLPFLAKKVKKIKLGAQDIHWEADGSFTGAQISAKDLISFGIRETLIGHSETRFYFGVNKEKVRLKLKEALKNKIFPTICIGETLFEKKKGKTKEVLERQIKFEILPVLKELKINSPSFAIAYEPIYAISGFAKIRGEKPRPAEISDVELSHSLIKNYFLSFGFKNVPVLYGGSCDKKNARRFLASPLVDGLLVGSASFDLNSFFDIIKIANEF